MRYQTYIKQLVCLLLAAALPLVLLAGCGQKDAADSGKASEDANGPVKQEEPAGAADTILWINGLYAVLTELNGWDYTVFGGMEPNAVTKKMMAQMLDEWWGVTDRDTAIENMDWLLTEGHRGEFAELMALLDEEGLAAYSEEENAAYLGEIFADETEGAFVARAYEAYKEKGPHAIDGWDLCRAMSLLGWYYVADYYTKSEALDKSLEVAQVIQKTFSSWDDLMDSYFLGYEYWSSEDSAPRRAVYEDIKSQDGSPYALPWDLPLERSWEAAPSVPGTSIPEDGAAAPQGGGAEAVPTGATLESTDSGTAYVKDFGSYTVPAGWVELDGGLSGKYFYLPEDQQDEEYPDNISVESGSNRYAAEDHIQFRQAIVSQLSAQIQGLDATLLGDGTFTDAGDYLYAFTITEPDVTTRQYYVVGDQKYCLIHLTSFTGAQEAFDAAAQIASGFQWAV